MSAKLLPVDSRSLTFPELSQPLVVDSETARDTTVTFLIVQALLAGKAVDIFLYEDCTPASIADGILELITFRLDLRYLVFSEQIGRSGHEAPWPIISAWRVDADTTSEDLQGEPFFEGPVGNTASLVSAVHEIQGKRFARAIVQDHVAEFDALDFNATIRAWRYERDLWLKRLEAINSACNHDLAVSRVGSVSTEAEASHEKRDNAYR